jgi:hypothetical protein
VACLNRLLQQNLPKAAVGRHAIVRSFVLDDGSLAHPTRFERVTYAFGALLLARPCPFLPVAETRPIG